MKNTVISCLLVLAVCANLSAEESLSDSLVPGVADQANLVVYRLKDASAINYRVAVDGMHVGKLKRDKALGLNVAVGEHIVSLNDADHTTIKVRVTEQGITYVHNEIDWKQRTTLNVTEPTSQGVAGLTRY